jgi:hypothetical protein
MKKRRSSTTRINPPSNPIQSIDYDLPPFHIAFPIKLTHKDGKEEKICYFMCKEHLQSYIKRYKLKKNQVKIENTPPTAGEN